MLEICPFNISIYGPKISSPSLCSPNKNNLCRAIEAPNYAKGCCYRTAETLLQIGADPSFVLGVARSIQDSEVDKDNVRQLIADELRVNGIISALTEAGIGVQMP